MVGAQYELACKLYPYTKVEAQSLPPQRHSVVVIGGGPVGLAAALDLGLRGQPVLLLDDHEGAGQGSRAICFAKRTLEIADRLGAGDAMLEKGVVWNTGKVFHRDHRLFEFNLQPESGHKFPAFINLQQPYAEKFLFDAIVQAKDHGAQIEIRGRNAVTGLELQDDRVLIRADTPDGAYAIEADWVIACDGARSKARECLGLSFDGRVFEDNFLIADVRMEAEFPTERWFWFEPPFEHAGQSALLHKQPDDIWRLDFQLGWDIDRRAELEPARVRARVKAMLGANIDFDLVWTSVYTFQCRRMKSFRHGRVLFAGDSAHQVSPFGARGANSGIQDAENLAWKLDLVLRGLAPERLMNSYDEERAAAADENILNSTRATDFLTPKSKSSRTFRDAVLALASRHAFARTLVNSGRLSVPYVYQGLSLTGPDALGGPSRTRPGSACTDAPLKDGFLLNRLDGTFTLLAINTTPPEVKGLAYQTICLETARDDPEGRLRERYLGDAPSALYLIRPDQHIVARWPKAESAVVRAAMLRSVAKA